MAKGGNKQRNNGSRFTKPYDASNSFVKKVALRVSDYIGGLFGSSGRSDDSVSPDVEPFKSNDDPGVVHSHYETTESTKSLGMSRCYKDIGANDSPAKRMKIESNRKFVSDFPISPIASTSSLFQSSVNHNFDIPNSEDFVTSVAGPSGLQKQKYAQTNSIGTSSTINNIKANGASDNHSDSSESTSGCSSLVPQSDRLSQSAFVSDSRKKILEEKLQYARQLKQSRASMYLNKSIPVVSDTAGSRRKPSFDVSAYGSPIFNKSSVREKMVNSPFYTGQTSYGGASAYRKPRTSLYSQQCARNAFEKRDGFQVQVKPSHHGSTEDLSNMSHTAKRILEALEQFSTPISDAKRIPVNSVNPPLGSKRKRSEDSLGSRLSLSSSRISPNKTKGPIISGLNVPTVPDLLKLKRLEKIQDSTAAARQVAVEKQEYSLPTDIPPAKHSGKIVTKLKNKGKDVPLERPPEVNLPKISLTITTLPKFDFKLPPMAAPSTDNSVVSNTKITPTIETTIAKLPEPSKTFTFSSPINLEVPTSTKNTIQKSNFTFSTPLKATPLKKDKSEDAVLSNLSNFMSNEALAKLKRKSINEKPNSTFLVETPKEMKAGSVMDLLRKTLENSKKLETESVADKISKPANDTWECVSCLIRNLNESKNCSGCKMPKSKTPSNMNVENVKSSPPPPPSPPVAKETEKKPEQVISGFGNKFKPPSDSWSCKECFVNNNASATKCIACENPKPQSQSQPAKDVPPKTFAAGNGFGDLFKKKAGQWECSVCMIQNKESDTKCVACESPKPGAKVDKPEPPKFNFGIPANAGGFKFGIDKANSPTTEPPKLTNTPAPVSVQTNGPSTESTNKPLNSIVTSAGVFTFGIPPAQTQQKIEKPAEDPVKAKEPEKPQPMGFVVPAIIVKEHEPVKATPSLPVPDAKDKLEDNSSKLNPSPVKNNFLAKPFAFDAQKSSAPSVFQFGSQENTAKPNSTDAGKVTFGISGTSNPPISSPSSTTGFTFGRSNLVNTQMTVNNAGNSDSMKSTSFFKIDSSAKFEAKSAGSEPKPPQDKPVETTPVSNTTTATTNSNFGSTSIFSGTAAKLNFGSASPINAPKFGDPIKAPEGISTTNASVTGFPAATSLFSPSNMFNGPATSRNVFGSIPTTTAAPSFSINTASGFTTNTESGFRPSTMPNFGSNTMQKSNFGIFNRPETKPTTGFGIGSAPSFTFGQPTSAPEKPSAPFGIGEANNNTSSSSAPVAPTTAPNVFTFSATKPAQFSNPLSQSPAPFTFGAPNPSPASNILSSFGPTKTDNPLGNSNTTFGNPNPPAFGQSSAPSSFGSSVPKFNFGSKQTASNQPFEFGATTQKPQASSTTFSTSIPESFNFTSQDPNPTLSATPSLEPPEQPRRMIRAHRRMQR